MEEKEVFVPCEGSAIVKTETISREQMRQEMLQETLLHNPEMNAEMRNKWNKERLKYSRFEDEPIFFKTELSLPGNYVEITKEQIDNDPEFQKTFHEEICVPCDVHLCKACFEKLLEESANNRESKDL